MTHVLSLTFALSGIIKELVTMLVSHLSGETELTKYNWLGFLICISGIAFHTVFKFRSKSIEESVSPSDEGKINYIESKLTIWICLRF